VARGALRPAAVPGVDTAHRGRDNAPPRVLPRVPALRRPRGPQPAGHAVGDVPRDVLRLGAHLRDGDARALREIGFRAGALHGEPRALAVRRLLLDPGEGVHRVDRQDIAPQHGPRDQRVRVPGDTRLLGIAGAALLLREAGHRPHLVQVRRVRAELRGRVRVRAAPGDLGAVHTGLPGQR